MINDRPKKCCLVCFRLLLRSDHCSPHLSVLFVTVDFAMSSELVQVAHDNLEYFKKAKFKNRTYHEFCKLFESLIKTVAKIHLLINNIKSFAPDYDLDKMSPGNGYRSFIDVYESAVDRTLKLCFRVKESRESIFFRKTHYEK